MAKKGAEVPGALEFLSTHPTGEHRQAAVKDIESEGAPAMEPPRGSALQQICATTSATAAPVGN